MSLDPAVIGNVLLTAWMIVSLAEMGFFVYASRRWLDRLMEAGAADEFVRTSTGRVQMREDLVRHWWSSPRNLFRGQPRVAAKYLRLLVRSRHAGSEEEKWRMRAFAALVALPATAAVALLLLAILGAN